MIKLDRSTLVATARLEAGRHALSLMTDADGADYANKKEVAEAWRSMRPQLEAAQHGKCGWCESLFDSAVVEIDHIRPKSRLRYWWLAFAVQNLLAACRSCNNAKRGKWPIRVAAQRLVAREDPWSVDESPMMLDPTREEPAAHLSIELLGGRWRIVGKSDRGSKTVEVLALDRDYLSRKLTHHLRYVGRVVEDAKRALRNGDESAWIGHSRELASLCSPAMEYSAMTSIFVRQEFHNLSA